MIDTALITVVSGHGGAGAVAFRREKFVPRGGPEGGDGGNGGNVVLVADPALNTLYRFRRQRRFHASAGGPGRGRNRHGASAEDTLVAVPVGTEVWDVTARGDRAVLVGDLTRGGERLIVARGGRGGRGNARFVTSTQREPRLAEAGESGERRQLRLELKLLADVGIIGLPNAGKSSLIATLTRARPKVADYPFTTLEPVLGVVEWQLRTLVAVDIPGLVEGAHSGVGLGDEFLKHIERTRLLIHLVDGSEPDAAARVRLINRELAAFNPLLASKRQLLVVNKLDMPVVSSRRSQIARELAEATPAGTNVVFVSAVARQGLDVLVPTLFQLLDEARREGQAHLPPAPTRQVPVLQPAPRAAARLAEREGDRYRVTNRKAVRLAQGSDLGNWKARLQFRDQLQRLGVLRKLEELGVKSGDTVLLGDIEMEWE